MRQHLIILLLISSTIAKTQTIVSNDLFRNLYLGVDNPISLTNLTIKDNNVVLKCDYGIIKKLNRTSYLWNICLTDKRIVYLKVYNDTKLVDSIPFKIVPLPNPTLFTCIQDNELMFKGCQGVRVDLTNFIIEAIDCKIERFTITILKNTGDTVRLNNVGHFYQSAAQQTFQDLQVGEKITLSDFLVTVGCETRPRSLTQTLSSICSGKQYKFRY